MTSANTQPKKGKGLCRVLRILTVLFAVLGPVALIAAAVVTTLLETDWWLELFLVYLALYTLLGFTSYLGLLAILWELTRRARRKNGEDLRDTRLTVILHRILQGAAVMGLATVVVIPLILFDYLNGGFAVIHFVIGGLMALLYAVLGVYTIIRRIIDYRRAEAQRLEEEKQAWEGYLS